MFFKENGWKNPISQIDNPYTFTHRTDGKTMWEFMAQLPDRKEAFNAAMQAQTAGLSWIVGIFPFEEQLSKVATNDQTVLAIDIGGGRGQAITEIRALTKTIKGRVILQDLPEVIGEIKDPLPGVELMKYNFFEPQPVKGIMTSKIVFRVWMNSETDRTRCAYLLHPPMLARLARCRLYQDPQKHSRSYGCLDLTSGNLRSHSS